MGRTMPTDCPHGVTIDWGDFGPCQDCRQHPGEDCPNFEHCPKCDQPDTPNTPHAIAAAVLGMDEETLRRRLLWGERVEQGQAMTHGELGRILMGEAFDSHDVQDWTSVDGADVFIQWLTRPEQTDGGEG